MAIAMKHDPPNQQLKPKAAAHVKRLTKKKPKDRPKRPLSAYNFFFKDERGKILKVVAADGTDEAERINAPDKEDHIDPERMSRLKKDGGKVSFEEMGKLIGQRWKNITPERLTHYTRLAADDTERYKRDMQAYNGRQEAKIRSEAMKYPSAPPGWGNGHAGHYMPYPPHPPHFDMGPPGSVPPGSVPPPGHFGMYNGMKGHPESGYDTMGYGYPPPYGMDPYNPPGGMPHHSMGMYNGYGPPPPHYGMPPPGVPPPPPPPPQDGGHSGGNGTPPSEPSASFPPSPGSTYASSTSRSSEGGGPPPPPSPHGPPYGMGYPPPSHGGYSSSHYGSSSDYGPPQGPPQGTSRGGPPPAPRDLGPPPDHPQDDGAPGNPYYSQQYGYGQSHSQPSQWGGQ